MENGKEYYAFISYKREDEQWAKWLQHKLEHYKLPVNLNGRSDLPKEIRPVFRDTSELNPGNLPQQIQNALEQSRYLIVVCSPRSAKSEWVNREVETFIGMGRVDKIIPFIIEGNAFSKESDLECFPHALRYLPAEQEILGANINEMGRDAAVVKVVAQMFGLRFDELWQRYEREQRKKRITTITIVVAAIVAALAVGGWIWKQRTEIRAEKWIRMEKEAKYAAEIAIDLTDKGLSYEAQRLLIEVLPKDLEHPDRPWVPAAEKALRYAFSHDIIFVDGDFGCASYSSDGKTIVAVSNDSIRILDPEIGKTICVLGNYEGARTAAFCQDGKRIVICSNKGDYRNNSWMENQSVKIIDVDNGKELFQLMGHEGRVDDLSSSPFAVWGPNGELIVSFSEYDGTIRLWDAVNGKELWRLNWEDKRYWCHGEPVRFSPDGKQILGLSNQFIRVWDVENGQEKFVIKNDEPPCDEDNAGFLCACYSPDSKYVFASLRGCIKGWDAENGKEVFNYNVGQGINYIDISSDWKVLLGLDVDEIGILDIQSGNSRRMVVSKGESFQFGSTIAKFAPDGQHFFTIPADEWEGGPDSGPIRIWKTSPVDSICDMEDYEINEIGVVNGKIVEISDAYIIVLDVKTKKEILKIERGEFALVQGYHGCDCASIRSDGKRLAYASAEGIIQIWDIERGEQINSFKMKMFDGGMQSVEYSPDGKCLLYGFLGFEAAPSGLLTLDAETGIVLNDFPGGGSASYSPDGKYVISEFINVYDVESREEIAVLDTRELNEGGLWEVFFAPDGKHIKAVFQDEYGNKKYKSWYWPSLQELIDKARERFEDNPLTPEERRQYHLE